MEMGWTCDTHERQQMDSKIYWVASQTLGEVQGKAEKKMAQWRPTMARGNMV